jgi:GPH family glycoside/pentoside/hexuronide:cation symporter
MIVIVYHLSRLSFPHILGFLKYLGWGASVLTLINASLITFTVSIFTRLVVAYLGDKVVTKYGRRKPFVFVGTIISILSNFILCSPPNYNSTVLFCWLAVFYSFFSIGANMVSAPYSSWLIESTADDADFARIVSISSPIGAFLGGITGLLFLIVSPILAAIVYAVVGGISLGLLLYFIPSRIYREAPKVPDAIPSVRICFQTMEFRKVFTSYTLATTGASIFGSMILFLVLSCYGINNETFIITIALVLAVLTTLGGLIVLVASNWVFDKIEKIKVLVALLWVAIALMIAAFISTIPTTGLYAYLVFVCIFGIIGFPINLISTLFTRDLVVYDNFVTGKSIDFCFLFIGSLTILNRYFI